ncbi:MAG: hypothetical protein E7602_07940 [Ruminococcaceae bacterium]|nr:hypothetical protein [Oscillospiraceae bacterium]
MKKKLLLAIALCVFLVMLFAISVSAETQDPYIEFKVKLTGATDYVNAYATNSSSSAPTLSFDSEFYSDNDLANVISKDTIVGIDLSSASAKNSDKTVVTSFTKASTPFANCKEIKWFNVSGSCNEIPKAAFQNWTALESFDFGIAKTVSEYAFNGSGLKSLVLPSTVTKIQESVFKECLSLKSVVIEGELKYKEKTSHFYGCTALETVDLGSMTSLGDYVFKNCTSLKQVVLPSTMTSIAKETFMGCSSLASVDLGNITQMNYSAFKNCTSLTEVTFPSTLTSIKNSAFYGCTSLKYVTFSSNVTLDWGVFEYCSGLENVDFKTAITTIANKTFKGCTSLKAVSIPEGCTTIKGQAFDGCTALNAIYLPSTLTTIGQAEGWGNGAFQECSSAYFVEKPFSVKDENGNWLGANFVQPTRETVYYMPSALSSIVGVEFRNCKNINDVVVFPTTLTSITQFEGAFSASGTSTCPKTYVFLGDMEKFTFSARDGRYNNVSFLFANPNDKTVTSMTFQHSYQTAPTNCYAYFCASGTYYDLNYKPTVQKYILTGEELKVYSYTEDMAQHIHNPRANKFCEATCTDAAGDYQYCFCGEVLEFVQKGSDALGHLYNDLKDQFYPENNYYANATCVYFCSQCSGDVTVEDAEGTKLFTAYGYSASEDDPSNVAFIVYANAENIKAYSEFKAISVAYGLVVSANTNGTPLTYADGSLTESSNTVKINMTGTDYNKLTVRVSNIGSFALHCNGYIVVGEELFYLNHATVDTTAQTITYAEMLELLEEAEGGTEEEIPEETPAE